MHFLLDVRNVNNCIILFSKFIITISILSTLISCSTTRSNKDCLLEQPIPENIIENYLSNMPSNFFALENTGTSLLRFGTRRNFPSPLPSYIFTRVYKLEYTIPRSRLSPIILLDIKAVPALLNILDRQKGELEKYFLDTHNLDKRDWEKRLEKKQEIYSNFKATFVNLAVILSLRFDEWWDSRWYSEECLDELHENDAFPPDKMLKYLSDIEDKFLVLAKPPIKDKPDKELAKLLDTVGKVVMKGSPEGGLVWPDAYGNQDTPPTKAYRRIINDYGKKALPELFRKLDNSDSNYVYFILLSRILNIVTPFEVYMADMAELGAPYLIDEETEKTNNLFLEMEIARLKNLVIYLREYWKKAK